MRQVASNLVGLAVCVASVCWMGEPCRAAPREMLPATLQVGVLTVTGDEELGLPLFGIAASSSFATLCWKHVYVVPVAFDVAVGSSDKQFGGLLNLGLVTRLGGHIRIADRHELRAGVLFGIGLTWFSDESLSDGSLTGAVGPRFGGEVGYRWLREHWTIGIVVIAYATVPTTNVVHRNGVPAVMAGVEIGWRRIWSR